MSPEDGYGNTPHIKWYNNGTDGHIFYDIPNQNMKNSFSFKYLNNKESISSFEKDDIFLNMLNTISTGDLLLCTDSFSELISLFKHEKYYIVHKLVIYKGKKAILEGEMFKVSKGGLIDFIKKSIDTDDMREFLITPITTSKNKKVFYLTEDLYYLYKPQFFIIIIII